MLKYVKTDIQPELITKIRNLNKLKKLFNQRVANGEFWCHEIRTGFHLKMPLSFEKYKLFK